MAQARSLGVWGVAALLGAQKSEAPIRSASATAQGPASARAPSTTHCLMDRDSRSPSLDATAWRRHRGSRAGDVVGTTRAV
eukprot:1305599-Pyramimonas_sp.AAC.1